MEVDRRVDLAPKCRMQVRSGISFAALMLGLLAVGAAVMGCKDQKALVVIRNSMPTPVTVTLDHKDVVVQPRQAVPVELAPGEYEMTANGLMLLETKTISLKSAADTAIYNVGGGADLALVSIPEGGGDSVVRPIMAPLTMLEPGEVLAKQYVNEGLPKIPPSVKPGVTSYYLCSYDAATKAIGCRPEK